ncbi:MAG: hypothetical protein ACOC12_07730 [Bacteroidota bacterium]
MHEFGHWLKTKLPSSTAVGFSQWASNGKQKGALGSACKKSDLAFDSTMAGNMNDGLKSREFLSLFNPQLKLPAMNK